MKENLICEISGEKKEVSIDRETGEFDLFDNHLKLIIQNNQANLIEIENNEEISICASYQHDENWYFEEFDIIRKDKDPFNAVIQLFYDILRH